MTGTIRQHGQRTITIGLDAAQSIRLQAVARVQDRSVNATVRTALEHYFAHVKTDARFQRRLHILLNDQQSALNDLTDTRGD